MPDPGWLLSQLSNPRNIFDILVVAVIIYWLLWFAQGTRATQLIRGIVLLLALAFIFGTTFQLTALNWVLQQTWPVLLISLPVIFQPEIRRALWQKYVFLTALAGTSAATRPLPPGCAPRAT